MNSQITKNNNVLELGKTYQFAGYKWTACELINKGKTLVIQSYVVPAAFNLDLSKVKVVGDEIIIIGNDNNDLSKNPSNNGGNFMTNELAKNIITEYVFADYDISSIYKFLNTEASLDESEKQLYSEALLTSAMQKAVIALSKPV